MTTAETLENSPNSADAQPETQGTEASLETGHAHNHDHDHDHDHDHAGHSHAPVMNPECVREVTIEASVDEVDKAFTQVLREYRKHARIPGFRAGKVPETVVKRRFAEQIRKDVMEQLLPERFQAAIQAAGLRPISQPQLSGLVLEEGKALEGKVNFEVVPPFSIDGYQDVAAVKTVASVSEEEFQAELKRLQESRATIEPVEEDRALVDGDWAQIAYVGHVQGEEAAPELKAEDSLVEIGGTETLAAFNEALRGARVGAELQLEVTYPAEYQEARLAGKTVAYQLTVKALKKRILPTLDDEFARELGSEFESLAALETRVREHLTAQKQREADQVTREALFAAFHERFAFPLPESLVQQQVEARLERGLRALAAQGMNADMMRKLDFGRLREAQRDSAMNEIRTSLILDRIADAEQVTVEEEEVDSEIYMASIETREPVEQLRSRLTQDGGFERIREQLRREKTVRLLVDRLPAA